MLRGTDAAEVSADNPTVYACDTVSYPERGQMTGSGL